MTTQFNSKEEAIGAACAYAGVKRTVVDGIIPKKDVMYNPLDVEHKYPSNIEIYTVENKDGKNFEFAIGKYRDGFDLWLITNNGMMFRV